jgi:1-acyl-sn-glycerol-3-phosphate acyltransferase
VGIFPEGQRMKDGSLGEGKIGVAFLASRTGAPVIPAGIVGAHRSMPVGALIPRPHRVQVVFGRPLFFPAEGPKPGREELNAFATRVMEEIARLSRPGGRTEASSRALEGSHR